MIYYFSGTGNSMMVARQLATLTNDKFTTMTDDSQLTPLATDEAVALVFPIFAWAMPSAVREFVKNRLPQLLGSDERYVYTVVTCGDDIGQADLLLSDLLHKHTGHRLNAAFSVQMPNTYVALPGFDVDSDSLTKQKLSAMPARVESIASVVNKRVDKTDVVRGAMPWLKSHLLRWLFERYLISDKPFNADKDKCTGCRMCMKACPVGNISMTDSHHPSWHGRCTGCMGCYHVCPQRAIDWGRFTKGKSQKRVTLCQAGSAK